MRLSFRWSLASLSVVIIIILITLKPFAEKCLFLSVFKTTASALLVPTIRRWNISFRQGFFRSHSWRT